MSTAHEHSHFHGHLHGVHQHGPSADAVVDSNKAYFNTLSPSNATKQSYARVGAAITTALLSHPALLPLSESTMHVLDYACGPGTVSQALLPHVASIVGVDVSTRAVEEYNVAAHNQGVSEGEMRAVVADLVTGEGDVAAVGEGFDMAMCSMAYHHMPSPLLTTHAITRVLKKGGILAVIDFRTHEVLEEGWKHIVPHNGFSEEQVKEWYKDAGLDEPVFVEVGDKGNGVTIVGLHSQGGDVKVRRAIFMAVGKKL